MFIYHPVVHSARKCERDEVQNEGEGAVVVHRQGEAAPLRQGRGCVGVCLCDTVHWGGRRKAGVTHPLIPSLINLIHLRIQSLLFLLKFRVRLLLRSPLLYDLSCCIAINLFFQVNLCILLFILPLLRLLRFLVRFVLPVLLCPTLPSPPFSSF